MKRILACVCACAALTAMAACGPDKDYGDPIDDPNARLQATGAIANASLLADAGVSNDSPLFALNSLSANLNALSGFKIPSQSGTTARLEPDTPSHVDAACVIASGSTTEYVECDFVGQTVNGSVTRTITIASGGGSTTAFTADLTFSQIAAGQTSDIEMLADLELTPDSIRGDVDFSFQLQTDTLRVTSGLAGDFDVELDGQGCAVGGQLEVHATLSGGYDWWTLAEFGEVCGDVTIR